MHKVALLLILVLTLSTSYLVVGRRVKNDYVEVIKEPVLEVNVFEKLKEPLLFNPVKIEIDGVIGILEIEQVGVESGGRLGVPNSWQNAGWYVGSAKPGEKGNVIIDGHYTTSNGSPAAFWGLKKIKVDDTVILQDELKRNFTYEVVDIYYVDIQDPQRTKVFEDNGEAELTLITCSGVWVPAEGTYNKRLVVKAKLI